MSEFVQLLEQDFAKINFCTEHLEKKPHKIEDL